MVTTNQVFEKIKHEYSAEDEDVWLMMYAIFEKERIEAEEKFLRGGREFQLETFLDHYNFDASRSQGREKLSQRDAVLSLQAQIASLRQKVEDNSLEIASVKHSVHTSSGRWRGFWPSYGSSLLATSTLPVIIVSLYLLLWLLDIIDMSPTSLLNWLITEGGAG